MRVETSNVLLTLPEILELTCVDVVATAILSCP